MIADLVTADILSTLRGSDLHHNAALERVARLLENAASTIQDALTEHAGFHADDRLALAAVLRTQTMGVLVELGNVLTICGELEGIAGVQGPVEDLLGVDRSDESEGQ